MDGPLKKNDLALGMHMKPRSRVNALAGPAYLPVK